MNCECGFKKELMVMENERDEARRQLCTDEAARRSELAREAGMSMWRYTGKDIARERGWDCFDFKKGKS
jgi:hypothetical protein